MSAVDPKNAIPPAGRAAHAPAAPAFAGRRPCPLCGATASEALPFRYAFRDRFLHGIRCRGCRLVFIDPQPTAEEIADMYSEAYFTSCSDTCGAHGTRAYMEAAEAEREERARSARDLDRRMRRFQPQRGRLLEIGCGPGFFLRELEEFGWRPTGLEISSYAADFARREHGLVVHNTAIEAAVIEPESFEAIVMGDVLEHLADPLAALRRVRGWLVPGGVALIAVPATLNLVSARLGLLVYRLLGREKTLRIPPYHLFEYTPPTLRRMLVTAGFEVPHLRQATVPLRKMGLRGRAVENAGKVALQLLAATTARLFNRGGDRLLAVASKPRGVPATQAHHPRRPKPSELKE